MRKFLIWHSFKIWFLIWHYQSFSSLFDPCSKFPSLYDTTVSSVSSFHQFVFQVTKIPLCKSVSAYLCRKKGMPSPACQELDKSWWGRCSPKSASLGWDAPQLCHEPTSRRNPLFLCRSSLCVRSGFSRSKRLNDCYAPMLVNGRRMSLPPAPCLFGWHLWTEHQRT
jgi:hypothetical protein